MRIILASQSEIRKRALNILGLIYETIPSYIDEKAIRDSDPKVLAMKLSEAKARAVGEKEKDAIIIASDAFMVQGKKIIEKPETLEEAFEMLKGFSGKPFEFLTGLVVYSPKTGKLSSTVESCQIHFRPLIDEEIHNYISRYSVLKYAGAVETDGVLRFADTISGNYNFMAGMPVNKLICFLREHGVAV